MKLFVEILIIFLASVNLLITRFALVRLRQPTTVPLWLIKVFTSALSPLLFAFSLFVSAIGLVFYSTPVIIISGCSVFLYLIHIVQTTRAPDVSTGLKNMFDDNSESRMEPERKSLLLSKRYVLWLPKSPEPIFEQDIPFYTIPGKDRSLLCDIWQPPKNIKHSGLAFIYLHGSAWTMLDKDYGTRTFFRHLASEGHVIMDVAYRLFPEADFMGMVHDTKHAIAWMKANAATYGINPERIIIGGGSAGAHLAMLAAYTATSKLLTPVDLQQVDLRVHGVISLYGQSDLVATYYHTCQHLTTHSALSKKNKSGGMPSWIQKRMGKDFHRLGFDKDAEAGMLTPMLGGTPDEKPEAYSLFSPITYVHQDCPATLIIHGKQDILAPVKAIRQLHSCLKEVGVPVAMHLIPQTDHGFDNILPKISPAAHNAIYDVERFLAIMAIREPVVSRIPKILSHPFCY
ncbi:alpha/beta hydrolase [Chitinophagaceae bacterium LB-8]|uniref:Alpha/beta hydrolase n=1 Tax=Paraflavisolibacter caeni TaxID=2982496 RepID=A0A9X2XPI0_9BACT|nr:alpha/beta hydrolase [Paraflavisolibacter caeni]MCU7551383.1 alpha/beta hydrolase [Paraflavisolibacter caeni]